jgi:hypothetical protein
MGTSTEQEQALAVFHRAAEEIRFFKTQQWLVTSYALTAFFALALAPNYIADCEKVQSCFCVLVHRACAALVLLTAILALFVLGSLEESHRKELNRMNAARQRLRVIGDIHTKFRFRPIWWFRWMQSVVRRIRGWFWGLPGFRHVRHWKLLAVRCTRRRFGPVNSGALALLHLGGRRPGETGTILRFALSIGAVLAMVINLLPLPWTGVGACLTAGP